MAATDKVEMAEQKYEAELTQRWLDGQTYGVEQVIAWLNQRAGEAYSKRFDKLAVSLRDTADSLKVEFLPGFEDRENDHRRDYLSDEK